MSEVNIIAQIIPNTIIETKFLNGINMSSGNWFEATFNGSQIEFEEQVETFFPGEIGKKRIWPKDNDIENFVFLFKDTNNGFVYLSLDKANGDGDAPGRNGRDNPYMFEGITNGSNVSTYIKVNEDQIELFHT